MVLREERKWQQRETRLLSDYIKLKYPKEKVRIRARVGRPPEAMIKQLGVEYAARMYKSWLRWADAIVLLPRKTIIIEAKLRSKPDVVGQLEYYKDLFLKTPEYKDRWDLPVELLLVTPWADPDLEAFASKKGVKIDYYVPKWIKEYLEHIKHYWSKEYREKRLW